MNWIRELPDIVASTFVKAIVATIEYSPEKIGKSLASFYTNLLLFFMRRSLPVARRNLEIAFKDLRYDEREKILHASIETLADNLYTFAKIPALNATSLENIIDISDYKNTMNTLRTNQSGLGVIICTMHYGCFELSAQINAILDKPLSILARSFGAKRLDQFWNTRREMFGNKVFDRKGGYREIVSRLKDGEDVAILCDQNVKRNHAVFIDFFGKKTSASKTIALASIRTEAPIILAGMNRKPDGTFEVLHKVIRRPQDVPGVSREEQIIVCTQEIHSAVEEFIKYAPQNWFWIHRRFKTRPEGVPENIYK